VNLYHTQIDGNVYVQCNVENKIITIGVSFIYKYFSMTNKQIKL